MFRKHSLSRLQWVGLILLIVLGCVLWYFSSRDGTISQTQSDWVARLLGASSITRALSVLIRKSAHFLIFLCVGISSSMLCANNPGKITFRQIGWACLIALMFASVDELHQHFVPGRSGELKDVLLDFAGASVGIVFVFGSVLHFQGKNGRLKGGKVSKSA